jgi:nucleoid-associated protein YgaU
MISRPAIIGVVGAIVVVAAVLLNYSMSEDAPLERAAPALPPSTSASVAVSSNSSSGQTTTKLVEPSESSDGATVSKKAEATRKISVSPIFDVVRVDPEGNTVIAGRSRPNTKVRIFDGDVILGEVKSDGRGEWVFVPEKRLEPGSRVLTLSSGNDGAGRIESKEAVVLVIPEPGKNIAGAEATSDRTPLAMVVPRDQASKTASRVIQAPKTLDVETSGVKVAGAKAPDTRGAEVNAVTATIPDIESAGVDAKTPAIRSFPEADKSGSGEQATSGGDAKSSVALDTVDYDDKGAVVFSGKAKSGDKVQIYVDNKLVGKTDADADGRWTLSPTATVKPGTHDIRVDKVAETGKVLARIELPFMRAKPFTTLPNQTIVIIQPGNNLWRIASKVYGDGLRYTDIFQANADQIRNADLIYPGQVFELPRTN